MVSLALPSRIRQRIDRWIETHNPPDRDRILLHNRRLYILPTRFGYMFAVMLMGMFVAAINYQNSMGFVLVFMLTALGIISLWQTHKNLLGISVKLNFIGDVNPFRDSSAGVQLFPFSTLDPAHPSPAPVAGFRALPSRGYSHHARDGAGFFQLARLDR